MKKIMLIAGCSHAAGAEIDGTQDSIYNRENSFGNILSAMMEYTPINIASSAASNPTIARLVLEWFSKHYDPSSMEVSVAVAWTESSRMELPSEQGTDYSTTNRSADWLSFYDNRYFRINQGWPGGDGYEKRVTPYYQKFIADNLTYLEILSANLVLQLQYYFKSLEVNYVMCNTMHMFSKNHHTEFFLKQIDKEHYVDYDNNDEAFYWKYKNAGYNNPKAQYWHHNEQPHRLYAEKLYNFITR
jgi:hypothetical protein